MEIEELKVGDYASLQFDGHFDIIRIVEVRYDYFRFRFIKYRTLDNIYSVDKGFVVKITGLLESIIIKFMKTDE